MIDSIVDEVRQVRDAHAARFNYDLDAIFLDLKEQERKNGFEFVAGGAHQSKSNPVSQPIVPASGGVDIPLLPQDSLATAQ